jgi:hypothetical protein
MPAFPNGLVPRRPVVEAFGDVRKVTFKGEGGGSVVLRMRWKSFAKILL